MSNAIMGITGGSGEVTDDFDEKESSTSEEDNNEQSGAELDNNNEKETNEESIDLTKRIKHKSKL